jgi:pimeloyl-ACP methyl ester carboxylesterase
VASFEHQGNRIFYELQGSGPDLLFMHGLTGDRNQAIAAAGDLPGYRLITVDMPGHGETLLSPDRSLEEQVSFKAYAGVALALLAHLGVERAVVGGISMGSGLALSLALTNPELCLAQLLVRPAWLDRPGRPHLDIIEDTGRWLAEEGQEGAAVHLEGHPVYKTALAENPNCATSILGGIHRPQAVNAAGLLSIMVADRPFARIGLLQKCTVPALVIGNNADPLHPVAIAREISGALANASYFHAPPKNLEPQEHQAAVLQRIEEFLTENL